MHCVQMLENVRRSFKGNASKLVMVIDCTGRFVSQILTALNFEYPMEVINVNFTPTMLSGAFFVFQISGMTLPCCNPKLGKKVMHVFADFYPERLGKAVVVNHHAIFQQIWRAIKKFLDPVTASKMTFIKQKKLSEGLREFCDESTAKWLETEILINKEITEAQLRFWEKPPSGAHDPRGTDEYIRDYVECKTPPNGFEPHPNIVDMKKGKLKIGYPVQIRNSSHATVRKADAKQIEEYGLDEAIEGDEDSD